MTDFGDLHHDNLPDTNLTTYRLNVLASSIKSPRHSEAIAPKDPSLRMTGAEESRKNFSFSIFHFQFKNHYQFQLPRKNSQFSILNSQLENLHSQFKKVAFTLAEVLITLGVIGVVAAMTMPVLINKYQERVTVTKFKKFYSTMSQAYLLSVKDNGPANEWSVNDGVSTITAMQIAQYLTPYLKIIKDCGTSSGCIGYTEYPTRLSGTIYNVNYDTDNRYYKAILADGSYIWWRGTYSWCKDSEGRHSDTCAAIFTDINGHKPPNTVGKDIFLIFITPGGVKPHLNNTCNLNSTGYGCSGYIL